MAKYVYVFECVDCYDFYGENTLTEDGRLLCPNCEAEECLDCPYVEQVAMLDEQEAYVPKLGTDNDISTDRNQLQYRQPKEGN
jgi:hypothetical protein